MQKVPLDGIATQDDSTLSLVPNSWRCRSILSIAKTSSPPMKPASTRDDINTDLVWIGYGIDAPEFNWNDYKDVDVKGKVLLMLVNEPPSDDPKFFAGKALTYYGRWTYKYEEAARKGAAGVILIHKTSMASYGWDVVRNSWSGERSFLRDDSEQKLKMAGWIQLEVGAQIGAGVRHESRSA